MEESQDEEERGGRDCVISMIPYVFPPALEAWFCSIWHHIACFGCIWALRDRLMCSWLSTLWHFLYQYYLSVESSLFSVFNLFMYIWLCFTPMLFSTQIWYLNACELIIVTLLHTSKMILSVLIFGMAELFLVFVYSSRR